MLFDFHRPNSSTQLRRLDPPPPSSTRRLLCLLGRAHRHLSVQGQGLKYHVIEASPPAVPRPHQRDQRDPAAPPPPARYQYLALLLAPRPLPLSSFSCGCARARASCRWPSRHQIACICPTPPPHHAQSPQPHPRHMPSSPHALARAVPRRCRKNAVSGHAKPKSSKLKLEARGSRAARVKMS